MKLATFTVKSPTGPTQRVGVKDDDELIDLTAGYARLLTEKGRSNATAKARALLPPKMKTVLANGDEAMEAVSAVKNADFEPDATGPTGSQIHYSLDAEEIDLQSPLRRPNSVRDCIVFEEHLRNTLSENIPDIWYEMPVYYKSSTDNIFGHNDTIEWPSYSDEADYELEIAVVIGKQGKDIDVSEADDYIAGYTIFNDFSARDIQMDEMEIGLGPSKGKDFANTFGPYIATSEEIDLSDASMRAHVNDELWSEGNVNTMYHSFRRIVEHASMDETLYPGDIIGSGTVGGGSGLELDRRLDDGDTVALEIEGIGTLQNTISKQ
jgi:2-keto-4-pentenoate hydratase/2-oxohepta-3-ene-1,7-dioic acid hydratase in catechol pathway